MDKAATVKMIAGVKCDIKSMDLTEPAMSMIDADTYALSYKATWTARATPRRQRAKVPSPVRSASIWVRSGDKWQAVFHGENLIVDPKNPVAPAAPPKKPKQVEPKKDVKTAANANTAANTAAPAAAQSKATPNRNTDALVKVELALWEAWKAHDAKEARRSDGQGRFICEYIRHLPGNQGRCTEGLDRGRLPGQERPRHRWLRHGSFADR